MDSLIDLVTLARSPETEEEERLRAFDGIVRTCQDMAYAYAYAILGDVHLAQDVAQEAFVTVWRKLRDLDTPATFPGWFRRIIQTQCDYITRRRRLPTSPLSSAAQIPSKAPDPYVLTERREARERVLDAIRSLPEHERTATTLYYVDGYTQNDVASFLGVKATTISTRLHSARRRLSRRLVEMVEVEIQSQRPSRDDSFLRQVGFITANPHLRDLLRDAGRIAARDCPVHIVGESGTGKMALARGIHEVSRRGGKPFVQLFCGEPGVPLESELPRLLTRAAGGTLALDEIDKMPLPAQDGPHDAIGANAEADGHSQGGRRPNVRFIAITNPTLGRDLATEVVEGRFRRDLYEAFAAATIIVPPLRERPEDVPPLAEHLLHTLGASWQRDTPEFAPEAMELLVRYDWPKNVRDLAFALEHALAKCTGTSILPMHLPGAITGYSGTAD